MVGLVYKEIVADGKELVENFKLAIQDPTIKEIILKALRDPRGAMAYLNSLPKDMSEVGIARDIINAVKPEVLLPALKIGGPYAILAIECVAAGYAIYKLGEKIVEYQKVKKEEEEALKLAKEMEKRAVEAKIKKLEEDLKKTQDEQRKITSELGEKYKKDLGGIFDKYKGNLEKAMAEANNYTLKVFASLESAGILTETTEKKKIQHMAEDYRGKAKIYKNKAGEYREAAKKETEEEKVTELEGKARELEKKEKQANETVEKLELLLKAEIGIPTFAPLNEYIRFCSNIKDEAKRTELISKAIDETLKKFKKPMKEIEKEMKEEKKEKEKLEKKVEIYLAPPILAKFEKIKGAEEIVKIINKTPPEKREVLAKLAEEIEKEWKDKYTWDGKYTEESLKALKENLEKFKERWR